MQVEINGLYFAARNIPQGRELPRFGIDLGLKKQIVNKQTELFLTASDIFNTMGIRQEINGVGFNAKYENYFETQIIKIGGRYKF